jgi:hypothetical protein
LEPVGTEEVLVEKIAQEYWRLGVAAFREADQLMKFAKTPIDRLLRYQTTINRQLFQAMNRLERLQRPRKGDIVPAPVNLQVLAPHSSWGRELRSVSASLSLRNDAKKSIIFEGMLL